MLHLPLRTSDVAATGWTSPTYREVIAHPAFDTFLARDQREGALDKIKVPVFAVGGWYDNYVQSDLEAYAALHKTQEREPGADRAVAAQHVVPVRGRRISARIPRRRFATLQMEWFDQWLMGKDSPLLSQPPVQGLRDGREQVA